MSFIRSFLLLLLFFSPSSQGQQTPAGLNSTNDKSPYLGLRYAGNKLPRGHKWIGGSLLTNPYSDEKQYGVTEVAKGRVKMIWLDRLTHHDATGNAHWEIKDVLFLPPMRKNHRLFYVDCLLANKPDSELVVITDSAPRGGYYGRVRHAWRANRQTREIRADTSSRDKVRSSGRLVLGSTLKALASSSLGLQQPWDFQFHPYYFANSERVREVDCVAIRQRFQRYDSLVHRSQGCCNPGLELANAFSVIRRPHSELQCEP